MAGNAFNQGTTSSVVIKSYFSQYDKGIALPVLDTVYS
jgi:hypothetical protein